ncbi:hypothetical protein B0H14DRAFT_3426705 [Mycena olivaceomarginata]|nr:hypothetical protein B0H14DRAFT_3426705 [Mycena olivaceomarginata]
MSIRCEWGLGTELRAGWAELLSSGEFTARTAMLADDLVVQGLFAQITRKPASRRHEPEQMLTEDQCIAHTRAIKRLFEAEKHMLINCYQTLPGLKYETDVLTRKVSAAIRDIEWTKTFHMALLCSALIAYCSPPGPPSVSRSFAWEPPPAVALVSKLRENEFVYELSGLMSTDYEPDNSGLSAITCPIHGTEHILFGPIRLVNHDCNPNAEFVHITGTRAMVVQTRRGIPRGSEILVNYGKKWFGPLCPCLTCSVNPVAPPSPGASGRREIKVQEQKAAIKARDQHRKQRKKANREGAEVCEADEAAVGSSVGQAP